MTVAAVNATDASDLQSTQPNVAAWNSALDDASSSDPSTTTTDSSSTISLSSVETALSVPLLSLIESADNQDDDPDDDNG